METQKIVTARFFNTGSGKEPVREWLKEQKTEDKKAIGEDIKAVEFSWPVGYPQVQKMDKDLWEVRSHISGSRISRIFFTVIEDTMILLHAIIKKTQKTPKEDLDLAKKRRDIVHQGGIK